MYTAGFVSAAHIPHTHQVLCSFHDGSVGVFDMNARHCVHTGPPAHTETIFDVRFRPSDPHTLATASGDSSVKVRRVCLHTA